GGAIGLLAYALWPTWARGSAWSGLADLVAAQRDYIDAVLAAIASGTVPQETQARGLARAARVARTRAEAAVGRSLTEPATRRIEADVSSATLGASRRLVQAAHVLRLDASTFGRRRRPVLEHVAAELHRLLALVEARLRARADAAAPLSDDGSQPPAGGLAPARAKPDIPQLRAAYATLVHTCDDGDQALLEELDELVDAGNGLAAAAGLEVDLDQDSDA
ncbi:MAG: hypothetical protein ACYC0H_22350, partial [Solirubrobacteraceae bacterium]